MPTLSCLVAPPCTLVLLIVCKRRSLPWLPLPSRSRLLLLLRGSTLSGSEVPSWLPSPPSNRCGSPSKNTMNAVPPLSTGNASKLIDPKPNDCNYFHIFFVIHSRAFKYLKNQFVDIGKCLLKKLNKQILQTKINSCFQAIRNFVFRSMTNRWQNVPFQNHIFITSHCYISLFT